MTPLPCMSLRRVAAACLCLLLASCGGGRAPVRFDPLTYEYLNKLRLNVATVEIDDSWQPGPGARHVESLSPARPVDALRQMIQQRLFAAGNGGRAHVVIQDASLIRSGDQYRGSFAVHLELFGDDDSPRGAVDARVAGTHAVTDDDTDGVRSDLYELTKRLMDSMNVELEYQLNHSSLHQDLQPTTPTDPNPAPVETQDLDSPPS